LGWIEALVCEGQENRRQVMANRIQQRVTIGDKTFMAAATPAQLAKLDERLRELISGMETTKLPYQIDWDALLEIEADVLGYRDCNDEDIIKAQADNDDYISDRLVELIPVAVPDELNLKADCDADDCMAN
jgi:hypothetical protein